MRGGSSPEKLPGTYNFVSEVNIVLIDTKLVLIIPASPAVLPQPETIYTYTT